MTGEIGPRAATDTGEQAGEIEGIIAIAEILDHIDLAVCLDDPEPVRTAAAVHPVRA